MESIWLEESPKVTQQGLSDLIRRTPALKDLYLIGEQYDDGLFDAFTDSKPMIVIAVSGSKFTGKGIAKLSGLPALQRLHLRNGSINDDGLTDIAKLPFLEDLTIENNLQPIGKGLRAFTATSRLKNLGLGNTRVYADDLNALKATLPNCKVNTPNPALLLTR